MESFPSMSSSFLSSYLSTKIIVEEFHYLPRSLEGPLEVLYLDMFQNFVDPITFLLATLFLQEQIEYGEHKWYNGTNEFHISNK
jgi:hypothetical protein